MYALIENQSVVQFPYDASLLRRDNPNVSFAFPLSDEDLAEWNVVRVHDQTPIPVVDAATQNCELSEPRLSGDQWVREWEIRDLTEEERTAVAEMQAHLERNTRNNHLTASDWTQLADNGLSPEDKAAWTSYRQSLRDLPSQPGFPFTVTYPERP